MTTNPPDRVIDGRELEPPEPFVLTVDALEVMLPHEKLLLLLTREPYPLYRALLKQGYAYQTEQAADGSFEILIWRNPA